MGLNCLIKQINSKYIRFRLHDSVTDHIAVFDLDGGVVDSTTECWANMEDWGDGWYLCEFAFTCDGSTGNPFWTIGLLDDSKTVSFEGRSQDAIYCWAVNNCDCANGLVGSYISSYSGGAPGTTHEADVGYLDATDIVSDQQGHLTMKYSQRPADTITETTVVNINDGGAATDKIELTIGTDNLLSANSRKTAGTDGDAGSPAGDVSDGAEHEVELEWMTNFLRAQLDDVSGTADTTCDMPESLDRVQLGSDEAGANACGGLIKELTISSE